MQNDHKSGILIITFGLRNNIKKTGMCIFFSLWALTQRWLMWFKQSQKKVLQYQYLKIKINQFPRFWTTWLAPHLFTFPNNASYWGSDIIAQWRPIRWKEKVDKISFYAIRHVYKHMYTLNERIRKCEDSCVSQELFREFKQLPGHKRWSGSTPESNRPMWIPNRSSFKHNPSQETMSNTLGLKLINYRVESAEVYKGKNSNGNKLCVCVLSWKLGY